MQLLKPFLLTVFGILLSQGQNCTFDAYEPNNAVETATTAFSSLNNVNNIPLSFCNATAIGALNVTSDFFDIFLINITAKGTTSCTTLKTVGVLFISLAWDG